MSGDEVDEMSKVEMINSVKTLSPVVFGSTPILLLFHLADTILLVIGSTLHASLSH